MVKQYVGARYVPKFASPLEWAADTSYEALTIVTFNNASYTSKIQVPPTVGNPANNPKYWALTGNYNAQVEQYRQVAETMGNNLTTEIKNLKNADTTLQGQITTVSNNLTTEITNRKNADTTLRGNIDAEAAARQTADNTLQGNIDAEAAARQTADNTLQGNINSEASTRATADAVLQRQIDNFVQLPSGSTTGDAELKNIRVKADGTTAATAGDAVRAQVADLENGLKKIPNSALNLIETCNFPLVLAETINGKYPAGAVGEKISFNASEGMITKKYSIPISVTAVYTPVNNSFTRVTAEDGTILASGTQSISEIPSGARFIYVSANKDTVPGILKDNIIWLASDNRFNYATEKTLYSPEYKSYYRDMIKPLWYDNLIDDSHPFITENDVETKKFKVSGAYNMLEFTTNTGNGSISMTFNATISSGSADVRLMYYNGSFHSVSGTVKAVTAGEQTIKWSGVDFASLIQYQSAQYFYVSFSCSGSMSVTLKQLRGKVGSNLSTYKLYSDKFTTMMQNVLSALESGGSTESEKLNLRSPDGDKYGLMITPTNALGTFKYVPDNMLIMGNSLVFGFSHGDESFGMAATSGENDFSYHVIEAIKEYNAGVNVNKLYSSPFEHAETMETAQTFLTENTAAWSADLDLVIIEMGDNVNTDEKRTVFAQSFPLLLNKIRTQCPKARVICVGIWFNNDTVYSIMTQNAIKYGCEFVDIRTIRSSETEGKLGATVYFKDGTTTTVTEGRATHPGNLGMELIANAIINKMDM